MKSEDVIEKLGLSPHPEGGYFRETYRSGDSIASTSLPARYGTSRSVSTAIYFLLTGKTFSAFHRLKSDEFWHYHLGDPVELHLIHPDGRHECVMVGPDLAAGHIPQFMIPHGTWFAATVRNADGFILLGCTVAPGFDFADFEMAGRDSLTSEFPQHAALISTFTR